MSALEKARKVNAERNARVQAASSGAGSARDRERQFLVNNAQERLKRINSGTERVSQNEFDRTVQVARGFVDPTTGRPTGRTLSPIPTRQPNRNLVSPLLTTGTNIGKQDLRINNQLLNRGVAPNIASSSASIRTPDGLIKSLEDEDLTLEQLEALQIISGQQATTQSLASQISSRRSAAILLGATDAEAQRFAVSGESAFKGLEVAPVSPEFINEKGEFGFNKRLQNNINTELQQKQVRRNAARLDAAELAIKNQTTDGRAGDLDNLRNILQNAPNQDKPVQRIIASTDERGNLVSRRNVALQTENALLTGTDENLRLDNIRSGGFRADQAGTNAPNIDEINSVIQNSIEKVTGESFRSDAVTSQLGPDGEVFIDFAPDVPQEIQGLAADQIADDLSSFFGGAGSRDTIRDQILDGQILDLGTIIPNFPEISGGGGGGSAGFPIVDSIASGLGLPIIVIVAIIIAIVGIFLLRRRTKIASI